MKIWGTIRERLGSVVRGNAARPASSPTLAYRGLSGELWEFDGRLLYNQQDIEDVIEAPENGVREWSVLSEGIESYKQHVYLHCRSRYADVAQRAQMAQCRMEHHFRRVFDEKMGGLHLQFGDGTILMHDLNVRALLAMYHVRPTEKAWRFLENLRTKLALILANPQGSARLARVHDQVQDIYDELESSLNTAPIDRPRLPRRPEPCVG